MTSSASKWKWSRCRLTNRFGDLLWCVLLIVSMVLMPPPIGLTDRCIINTSPFFYSSGILYTIVFIRWRYSEPLWIASIVVWWWCTLLPTFISRNGIVLEHIVCDCWLPPQFVWLSLIVWIMPLWYVERDQPMLTCSPCWSNGKS